MRCDNEHGFVFIFSNRRPPNGDGTLTATYPVPAQHLRHLQKPIGNYLLFVCQNCRNVLDQSPACERNAPTMIATISLWIRALPFPCRFVVSSFTHTRTSIHDIFSLVFIRRFLFCVSLTRPLASHSHIIRIRISTFPFGGRNHWNAFSMFSTFSSRSLHKTDSAGIQNGHVNICSVRMSPRSPQPHRSICSFEMPVIFVNQSAICRRSRKKMTE